MEHKVCTKCSLSLPLDMFYKHSKGKFGIDSKCKKCLIYYRCSIPEKNIVYSKNYRSKNPEKVKKSIKKYSQKIIGTDVWIKRRLSMNLRKRLRSILNGKIKTGSAVKDLGCSIEFLKEYLESKFQPGMTWENRKSWHIDHIKPLSKFNLSNREELLKAVHYTNLQPLWASDNMIKGNRLI